MPSIGMIKAVIFLVTHPRHKQRQRMFGPYIGREVDFLDFRCSFASTNTSTWQKQLVMVCIGTFEIRYHGSSNQGTRIKIRV